MIIKWYYLSLLWYCGIRGYGWLYFSGRVDYVSCVSPFSFLFCIMECVYVIVIDIYNSVSSNKKKMMMFVSYRTIFINPAFSFVLFSSVVFYFYLQFNGESDDLIGFWFNDIIFFYYYYFMYTKLNYLINFYRFFFPFFYYDGENGQLKVCNSENKNNKKQNQILRLFRHCIIYN